MVDEPQWSPDRYRDGVYARAAQLRRRRTRLLVAGPVAAIAAVVLVAAVAGAGGSPAPAHHLRVAGGGAAGATTTTTVAVGADGTADPGGGGPAVGSGQATTTRPPRTVAPGGSGSTTTTAVRSTVVPRSSTTTTVVTAGRSGVTGTVMFGPQCPVQRADGSCPDKPGPASVELRTSSGTVVGRDSAGQDGRFSITAPPGQYTVVATPASSGPGRGCAPADATVTAGHYADVTVSCDTGIR